MPMSEVTAGQYALLALLAYVAGVGIAVTAGVVYGHYAKLRYAEPLDPAQTAAFLRARAGLFRRARALVIETLCQATALAWQALHKLRLLRMPRGDRAATPIVVLPGYTENSGNMWFLGRFLARRGFNPILVDFPSTFRRIEDNAAFLGDVIARVRAEHGGTEVAVVAHSMGGLVTRALLRDRADHGVAALVAIAAPFRGTHIARVGAALGFGKSVEQMVPGSEFLRRFPPSLPLPVPLLSIVAFQESIVSPEWSVVIEGAEVHVLDEPYGHEAPLFVPAALRAIEAWLVRNGVTRAAPAE
jgi:pimeloyl-ACP methyl ester carboxylesterase